MYKKGRGRVFSSRVAVFASSEASAASEKRAPAQQVNSMMQRRGARHQQVALCACVVKVHKGRVSPSRQVPSAIP